MGYDNVKRISERILPTIAMHKICSMQHHYNAIVFLPIFFKLQFVFPPSNSASHAPGGAASQSPNPAATTFHSPVRRWPHPARCAGSETPPVGKNGSPAYSSDTRSGAARAAEMTQHKQITGHAGGGFTVRQTGSCRFLFHANIHWAYYKISSAGYRVPFAFFQFDFF